MAMVEVDLYSDTQTRPSRAMRAFMCEAEVGDEQRGEDPTVNELQEMVADLLGKESALFLPSGTMCNEIALKVHVRPGDEVLLDRTAHPIHFESGAPGMLSGAILSGLDGARGVFTPEQVETAVHAPSRYAPRTRLLWVENTSNLGGGTIWPLERVEAVCEVAQRHGLAAHMDGARLMNAVVASGVSAREYAALFDSVWIDFTKGLGAPVGAALAGSREFIDEAWRYKQAFGGAMRQAGIIAAGAVYALRHNVERLADDHANARRLAGGLAELPGISIDPATVETNILFFDVVGTGLNARAWADALLERGVRMGPVGGTRLRAVTHRDVDRAGIERALAAAREVCRAGV
jgi:threonine aldolase